MSYYNTIASALRDGSRLHAFLSGGGLRVVNIDGTHKGYGEHPNVEDALSHAAEDLIAGGRPYHEVYGGSKPHYITGSTQSSSRLDAWIRQGSKFDARAVDGEIVVELRGYGRVEDPPGVHERARAGESVRWSAKGFVLETVPYQFANGEMGSSTSIVSRPEGSKHDPWLFPIVKTGRAKTLEGAIAAAFEAEDVEVER